MTTLIIILLILAIARRSADVGLFSQLGAGAEWGAGDHSGNNYHPVAFRDFALIL